MGLMIVTELTSVTRRVPQHGLVGLMRFVGFTDGSDGFHGLNDRVIEVTIER